MHDKTKKDKKPDIDKKNNKVMIVMHLCILSFGSTIIVIPVLIMHISLTGKDCQILPGQYLYIAQSMSDNL